jgi:hypothetical protein
VTTNFHSHLLKPHLHKRRGARPVAPPRSFLCAPVANARRQSDLGRLTCCTSFESTETRPLGLQSASKARFIVWFPLRGAYYRLLHRLSIRGCRGSGRVRAMRRCGGARLALSCVPLRRVCQQGGCLLKAHKSSATLLFHETFIISCVERSFGSSGALAGAMSHGVPGCRRGAVLQEFRPMLASMYVAQTLRLAPASAAPLSVWHLPPFITPSPLLHPLPTHHPQS